MREVDGLHERLIVDISQLSPAASAYVRRHGFLTEEVARDWQVGCLPMDAGGGSGGTVRGKFVTAIHNRYGNRVAYPGRDLKWEEKHEAWIRGGRTGKEPAKWSVPKGFHRGVEVYGQDRIYADPEGCRERLKGTGLVVNEGPLDVINFWEALGIPSVGLLSNHATDVQIERIAELANEVADGVVTLAYDCNEAGEQGMDSDTVKFSKHCRVQRALSADMYGGALADKEGSDITPQDWEMIRSHLQREASEETAGE